MNVKEKISSFVLDKAMDHISGDPETNLPVLLERIDALGIPSFEPQSKVFHEVLDDTDNNWYKYIMGLWRDTDNDVLKSVFRNFALKSVFGLPKQKALSEKYGCNIPIWSLARLSTIPIPTYTKRPCLKPCDPRCSWPIMIISRSTRII
ncbi:MAG: hypothetical protein FWG32_03400 [Oscillospiraceae bacterium]|nr:hypothetical protein [Oscillospiraceae bacterium]